MKPRQNLCKAVWCEDLDGNELPKVAIGRANSLPFAWRLFYGPTDGIRPAWSGRSARAVPGRYSKAEIELRRSTRDLIREARALLKQFG